MERKRHGIKLGKLPQLKAPARTISNSSMIEVSSAKMRLYVNGASQPTVPLECRRESHLLNSATMFALFCRWFGAVLRIFHNRQNRLLENLALRQQLVVFRRVRAALIW